MLQECDKIVLEPSDAHHFLLDGLDHGSSLLNILLVSNDANDVTIAVLTRDDDLSRGLLTDL